MDKHKINAFKNFTDPPKAQVKAELLLSIIFAEPFVWVQKFLSLKQYFNQFPTISAPRTGGLCELFSQLIYFFYGP